MKLSLKFLAVLFVSLILFSCDNGEEVDPSTGLENASLSFDPSKPPVEIPTAMMNSSDPKAIEAVGYIALANGMSSYLSNLTPPPNADKSNDRINGRTTNGGRVSDIEDDVLVYTWTSGDISVAYQISETPSKYTFELFWKLTPTDDYVRVLHAEESKLVREGFMEWSFDTSDDFLFRYEWSEAADGTFYFDMLTPDNSLVINIVSKPDKSGSVKYYIEGELLYDISWAANGSGSWAFYSEGEIIDSGTWTV